MKADKILSLIMAAAIPFPLLLAGIASAFEKIPSWAVLGGIAGGIVSWILGQLLGILLKKASEKAIYFVRVFSVIAGIILTALFEVVIFSAGLGSLAPFFVPLAYIFWYWFGFRASSGQRLISYMVIGGYGLEAAFMYPICASFNGKAALYIIILTAFLTVTGALLINFRQVSGLSLRGKSENKLLTKACARFNIKATLIFCGIILFAFFFCGVGAKWLWEGIKAVIRYIIYLMSLLGAAMNGADNDGDIPDSPFAEIPLNDNLVGQVLTRIAVIVLAVIFFKHFVRFIKRLYRAIMDKLGRKALQADMPEYTDIYQTNEKKRTDKNTFKKAFKAFLREKNADKKFRLGYKAFMTGLTEKNLELSPSDTPACHREKGSTLTQSESLYTAVDRYYSVRYDGISPTKEDCEVMKELLREIR